MLAIIAGFTVEQTRLRKKFDPSIGPEHLVEITIACHLGMVDFFQDVTGNRNCFGPGMNDAARILDLGKQAAGRAHKGSTTANTIFFGAELLPQMTAIKVYANSLPTTRGVEIRDLGNQPDKHGIPHRIYWLTNPPSHLALLFESLHGGLQPGFFRA